jgi:hypothetical protein
MNVTATPVNLGKNNKIIQNIGPDPVRVGYANVTADNGLHLTASAACVVGSTGVDIYVMCSGTSADVRVLEGGTGFALP